MLVYHIWNVVWQLKRKLKLVKRENSQTYLDNMICLLDTGKDWFDALRPFTEVAYIQIMNSFEIWFGECTVMKCDIFSFALIVVLSGKSHMSISYVYLCMITSPFQLYRTHILLRLFSIILCLFYFLTKITVLHQSCCIITLDLKFRCDLIWDWTVTIYQLSTLLKVLQGNCAQQNYELIILAYMTVMRLEFIIDPVVVAIIYM